MSIASTSRTVLRVLEDPSKEDVWDRRVETWQEIAATPAFVRIAQAVLAASDPRPDDQVVDLGAGTGLLALALAPHVARVSAVDFAPQMLDRLRDSAAGRGLENVVTVVADLRWLPLPDESASLVVSSYAFHHLRDVEKELALSEARRILRPGGRLVVCDMMFALSLESRDRRLILTKAAAIARRGPAGILRLLKNAGRIATGTWEHPAPADRWREMLERRGFAEVAVQLFEQEAGLATARRPVRETG